MPPRSNANRRRGKIPPKRNTKPHSSKNPKPSQSQQAIPTPSTTSVGSNDSGNPSDTLQALLDNVNLEYDSSLGILQGDSIQSKPNQKKLVNMKSLLERLIKELDVGIKKDEEELIKLSRLSGIKVDLKTSDSTESRSDKLLDDLAISTDIPKKKESSSIEKKRKLMDMGFDSDGGSDNSDASKIKIEDDDEDDLALTKRKRRNIIITANGERKEITPTMIDDADDADAADDDDHVQTKSVEIKGEAGDTKLTLSLKKDSSRDKEASSFAPPLSSSLSSEFIPSVYANDSHSKFDINKMLEPAVTALRLFNEEKAKEDSQTEHEFLQKKYAVTEYPASDLKDLLPGEIPMIDFSGSKPSNQIAFTSFQTYVDPFFRNYNEEDLRFLRTKATLSTSLSKEYDETNKKQHDVPVLGPYYQDVWHDEDVKNGLAKDVGHLSATKQMELSMKSLVEPKGSSEDINNEILEAEDISCGPLTSRLLSALINEDGNELEENEQQQQRTNNHKNRAGTPMDHAHETNGHAVNGINGEDIYGSSSALPDQQGWQANSIKADYKTLDERLKRELKYIGVYMNVQQTLDDPNFEQDWCFNKEDDEVSSEIRILQKDLKKIQQRNNRRKKILIPTIEEHISWQEYMSILEDLDKQVEQYYRRRINVAPKKNKKKSSSHSHSNGSSHNHKDETHLVTNASFRSLLEKRSKWIEKIGPLFRSQLEMRRMPSESIFKDLNDDDENNNEEEELLEDGDDVDDDDVVRQKNDDEQQVQGESLSA